MIEYPVFGMMPDFSSEPLIRVLSMAELLAISPAAATLVGWPEEREETSITYQMSFGTLAGAIAFKRAMQAFGGRHEAFFMPSWSRDFELASLPVYAASQITVTDSNFNALLTSTYPDRPARHLFIACPVNGVHAVRVLRAVGGVLDIEPPFPWDVTEGAMCGILGLVRMESDEIEISHTTPGHISTTLAFRTVRATININRAVTLDNAAVYYGFGPFTKAVQKLEPAPTLRYDFEQTKGPANYGVVSGLPFTTVWSGWLGTDGIYFKKGTLNGTTIWAAQDSDGDKSELFDFRPLASHVSIAFDGDSREVLAIELPGGKSCVRGWMDGERAEFVFDGMSPRLVQRDTVTGEGLPRQIDIACFYIKPGDAGIYARFEFDAFADEICLGGWPSPPLVLLGSEGSDYSLILKALDVGHRTMTIQTVFDLPPDPTPTPTPPATPVPTPPIPTPPPTVTVGPTPTPPVPTPTPPATPTPPPTGTIFTPTPTPPPSSMPPSEEPPPEEGGGSEEPPPFDPTPWFEPTPPPEPTPWFEPTPFDPTPAFDPTPWFEPTPAPEPTPWFEPTPAPEPTPFDPTPPPESFPE